MTEAEAAPIVARRATEDDLHEVVVALARAFDDDPVLNWMVRQDRRRRQRIARIMKFIAEGESLPHDELWTTAGPIAGAACWVPPGGGDEKRGLLRELLELPSFGRVVGWRRLPFVMRGLNQLSARHPRERPHYYLPAIGVAPEHQGKGIGSVLLRAALDRCDSEGVPAYLESSKESNVPLYERHGFRVTEMFTLPGGPPLWLMWREPE